jgi:hypothetical protein
VETQKIYRWTNYSPYLRLNRTCSEHSDSHYRYFKIYRFCDYTFQTHFKERMSLYGYQNTRSCVCPCVSLHTDNIEKMFQKRVVSVSYDTMSLLQVILREVLFVLNVPDQYVLSGNYSVQGNQKGTDWSVLGNINRHFT